jgi:hypothetical protein
MRIAVTKKDVMSQDTPHSREHTRARAAAEVSTAVKRQANILIIQPRGSSGVSLKSVLNEVDDATRDRVATIHLDRGFDDRVTLEIVEKLSRDRFASVMLVTKLGAITAAEALELFGLDYDMVLLGELADFSAEERGQLLELCEKSLHYTPLEENLDTRPLLTRIQAKTLAKERQAAARATGRKLSYTQALAEIAKDVGFVNVHEMTSRYALAETKIEIEKPGPKFPFIFETSNLWRDMQVGKSFWGRDYGKMFPTIDPVRNDPNEILKFLNTISPNYIGSVLQAETWQARIKQKLDHGKPVLLLKRPVMGVITTLREQADLVALHPQHFGGELPAVESGKTYLLDEIDQMNDNRFAEVFLDQKAIKHFGRVIVPLDLMRPETLERTKTLIDLGLEVVIAEDKPALSAAEARRLNEIVDLEITRRVAKLLGDPRWESTLDAKGNVHDPLTDVMRSIEAFKALKPFKD